MPKTLNPNSKNKKALFCSKVFKARTFDSRFRISRSLLSLNRDREYMTLRRMIELGRTDNLLDVGSGDGFWTAHFAKHCAHVTGLEPNEQALQYARRRNSPLNVAYVQGVTESLPFPDCTFEKLVSISCLQHFADPLKGIREMTRVLKPGGRLAFSTDSLLPENSSSSFRRWHRSRHFVNHYFKQEKLLATMETLGLRCELRQTTHLFRSRIAGFLRQIFMRHPRFWLPLFPLFYTAVRLADLISDDMHGQTIIVTSTRSLA